MKVRLIRDVCINGKAVRATDDKGKSKNVELTEKDHPASLLLELCRDKKAVMVDAQPDKQKATAPGGEQR